MSSSPEAVNHPRATGATLLLLCACFLLSGIAALIYQTAWTRQFAIVFGTSELAVATVLAAYMGGLALGAWLAERFLPRVTRPVLTYALLELGIALGAMFAVPLLLWLANLALVALFGGQPSPPDSDHAGTTLFYLVSAFAALALPTTLMGATLPMLARYAVAEEAQIGRRIGLLYATNTAGAVFGALLTAFFCCRNSACGHHLVRRRAECAGVPARRGAVATRVRQGTAQAYTRRATRSRTAPHSRAPTFNRFPAPGWVLPLMLLAGAVAFFQEVLWTRMLAHVVGSSIYAFGVMVASFLSGIALGGGIGAALGKTANAPRTRWAPRSSWRRPRPASPIYSSSAAAQTGRPAAERARPRLRAPAHECVVLGTAAAAHDHRHRHDLSTRRARAGTRCRRCGAGQRARVRLEHRGRHRRFAGGRFRADSRRSSTKARSAPPYTRAQRWASPRSGCSCRATGRSPRIGRARWRSLAASSSCRRHPCSCCGPLRSISTTADGCSITTSAAAPAW